MENRDTDSTDWGRGGLVPVDLDGRANVYFDVCPRQHQGDKAHDAAVAVCLLADDVRIQPLPEDLAAATVILETSPRKYQAYWLLDELIQDSDQVEQLNRRPVEARGGGNVADGASVMRPPPAFLNLKPARLTRPVSALVELHPGRRYTLADPDAAILPLQKIASMSRPGIRSTTSITAQRFRCPLYGSLACRNQRASDEGLGTRGGSRQ